MSEAAALPRVTVIVAASLDGRIVGKRWGAFSGDAGFEAAHAEFKAEAWMCGRLTMRGYTRGTPADDTDGTRVPRTDFIARPEARSLAVALDFSGRLHWGWRNDIEGDHVVVVTGENVPDEHLNALRASGVSYLFAGRDTLDLPLALRKLRRHFGVEHLLVEGGGGVNGSMLKAGLVDEVVMLMVPAIDGGRGIPAAFDVDVAEGEEPPGRHVALKLLACQPGKDGVVRLHYRVEKPGA